MHIPLRFRHLIFSIGMIGIIIICFIGFILLQFIGHNILSFVLPISLTILYGCIWICCTTQFLMLNKPLIGITCVSALIFLSSISYFLWQDYRSAQYHATPSVKEFDIDDYRPFYSDKLAKLNQPSTLQLTENLPKLDGSTALYPMYAAFVQAVYPQKLGIKLDSLVQSNKTSGAYQRLINGEVDIIFAPAPSKTQQALAQKKGLTFHLSPVGQEAFVFFVNINNPIDNLTLEQIQQIYAGNIKNWQEIGGKMEKIRAFQRPENSGSQTALQKMMGDIPIMPAPYEDVPAGMGGMIRKVADYRNFDNALGFSFLLYSTQLVQEKQIKLLSINGIAPNHANIRNKSYPFSYDFYAVTIGNPSKETQQLLDWIQSPQGKELIEKTGYVPIP